MWLWLRLRLDNASGAQQFFLFLWRKLFPLCQIALGLRLVRTVSVPIFTLQVDDIGFGGVIQEILDALALVDFPVVSFAE